MSRRKKRVPVVLLIIVTAIIAGGTWYVNDYYRADMEAIELFASEKSISAEVLLSRMRNRSSLQQTK